MKDNKKIIFTYLLMVCRCFQELPTGILKFLNEGSDWGSLFYCKAL